MSTRTASATSPARSPTPPIVVVGAEGSRIEADDGRTYIDFAGGIGCQNLGHGPSEVVAAIHEQVDRYLHQCFMVGMYEPYVGRLQAPRRAVSPARERTTRACF